MLLTRAHAGLPVGRLRLLEADPKAALRLRPHRRFIWNAIGSGDCVAQSIVVGAGRLAGQRTKAFDKYDGAVAFIRRQLEPPVLKGFGQRADTRSQRSVRRTGIVRDTGELGAYGAHQSTFIGMAEPREDVIDEGASLNGNWHG
ncbi:MAG: hypothetical protein ACYDGM_12550 [Vulcanimicrobiaceae bacterium]